MQIYGKFLVYCIIIHIFARIILYLCGSTAKNTESLNMEREELLGLVNEELGNAQLTLSEQTINEELDDSLEDFGDNEEANAKLVSKIANRLKRIDGNLHADVSKQVSEYKKQWKDKKTKQEPKQKQQSGEEESETLKQMRAELDALKAESETRKKTEARNAVLESVKKGLREKMEKNGMEVNNYFVKTAVHSMEIPDEGADIEALVSKAEKAYNAGMKEAGITPNQKPRFGAAGGKGSNAATDFFARKAKKEGWGKK